MFNTYICPLSQYYNRVISCLLLISLTIFLILSYYIVQNSVDNIKLRANRKLQVAEKFIGLSLDQASQIMHALSLTLASEQITIDDNKIFKLVKNFTSQIERFKVIPLYALKVINSKNQTIVHSLVSYKAFVPLFEKSPKDLKLLAITREDLFDLHIGEIRVSSVSKDEIIPFCMAIHTKEEFKGYLCSGFTLKNLSEKLFNHIEDENIKKIKLLKAGGDEDIGRHIDNCITFSSIMSAAFRGQPLIIYQPLNNYQLLVRAEIDCYFLSKEIWKSISISIAFFLLLGGTIYCLLIVNYKLYKKPLIALYKKMLSSSSTTPNNYPYICENQLCSKAMGTINIINYCSELITKLQKVEVEKSSQELKSNILELLMQNDYRYSEIWDDRIKTNCVYLKNLKDIVNSKEQSVRLKVLLDDIVSYCSEYFSELDIKLIIANNENENILTLKKQALIETIFSILISITRMENFCIDSPIIVRVETIPQNNLCKIRIETSISELSIPPSGWEFGTKYTCTGLLSSYLLAKENNLFFFIETVGNRVLFNLEPYPEENTHKINNMLKKHLCAVAN